MRFPGARTSIMLSEQVAKMTATKRSQDSKHKKYEVIVIWESDWRTDKNACMKRIKDAFDRTL